MFQSSINQAQASQVHVLDDLIAGMTKEFMQLHKQIFTLSIDTGVKSPGLVKAAEKAGVSLDQGAGELLLQAGIGAALGALGLNGVAQFGLEMAGNLQQGMQEQKILDAERRSTSGQFNSMSAANRNKKTPSAQSVLLSAPKKVVTPAAKPQMAVQKVMTQAERAQKMKIQLAKMAQFDVLTAQLAQLNGLKALGMGIETVVITKNGDYADAGLPASAIKPKASRVLPALMPSFARKPSGPLNALAALGAAA